jgi:hypothetical protein
MHRIPVLFTMVCHQKTREMAKEFLGISSLQSNLSGFPTFRLPDFPTIALLYDINARQGMPAVDHIDHSSQSTLIGAGVPTGPVIR